MQLSLLPAHQAINVLADSWMRLESSLGARENSNSFIALAEARDKQTDSELKVLCVHEGRMTEELVALCILEHQRSWVASKCILANWVNKPGADCTPLIAPEQRFSALDTWFRDINSLDPSSHLHLRHLIPESPFSVAVSAVATQRNLSIQSRPERRGTREELIISLARQSIAPAPRVARTESLNRSHYH